MRSLPHDRRKLLATWILDSHRLGEAGLARLAWLNIALSLAAGFAAVALGHWLGGTSRRLKVVRLRLYFESGDG